MCSAPLHVPVRQCDPKQKLEATSQIAVETQDKLLFCLVICKDMILLTGKAIRLRNSFCACANLKMGSGTAAAMRFGVLKFGTYHQNCSWRLRTWCHASED